MKSADEEIQQLSDRLGLTNHRQDWGISNADPGRVEEFIRLARTEDLTGPQQYVVGELVLASMNEALVEDLTTEALIAEFHQFLALDLRELPAQVRCWAGLSDNAEFPIAGLLGNVVSA